MEKERRTKALVVVVLLIVIAGLTVAFAALSTTLNINGTAYLDASKWGIKFQNLSEPEKIGTATVTGTAKIEETKSAEINGINVSLSTPGDKVTYTVDLVNEGTINAKIDKIEKTELTSEQQKYLTFKITDKSGNEVSEGDILSAGETRNLTITIEFIKDLTKEDLPTSTSTISLSYKLNFVQTDEKITSAGQGTQQACTAFDKKDTYSQGDVIALCNTSTNKSEDFYVMKDNGDTVTALARYNLLVGNTITYNDEGTEVISSATISSSEEGYGLQSSTTKTEFDSEGNPLSYTIKGVVPFSEDNYWIDSSNKLLSKYGSNYPAYVFDSNSSLYVPLLNYKNYLINTIGIINIETRLITFSEYENIIASLNACDEMIGGVSYWTGTAYDNEYLNIVWANCADNSDKFDSTFGYGLRPVITIKKSDL